MGQATASTTASTSASASVSGSAKASASASAASQLPPLEAPSDLVDLPLEGLPTAVVSVPRGATSPRPVAIASHGNYDRPEWQCTSWRAIVAAAAFVLCPRGKARPDSPSADDIRFTYSSIGALQREVTAGLAALRKRWPRHVAEGPILYTGFSLGAIMGIAIATQDPKMMPRMVLVEGGHDAWTAARASQFARGGGQRVLFVCGRKSCAGAARVAARRLEAAGVATDIALLAGQGHSYGGELGLLTKRRLGWLLEGDLRWRP